MTPVPSRGNRFSESPGAPVIWPCLTTAWMPSPNTGARGAPITIVVATTTGRDAKKSSPDEARDPLLGRRPDDPTTRMRQITEFPTPGGPDQTVRRHLLTTNASSASGAKRRRRAVAAIFPSTSSA